MIPRGMCAEARSVMINKYMEDKEHIEVREAATTATKTNTIP